MNKYSVEDYTFNDGSKKGKRFGKRNRKADYLESFSY